MSTLKIGDNSGELVGRTTSLCPICLRKIAAEYRRDDAGRVLMDKTCPDHGRFVAMVWGLGLPDSSWGDQLFNNPGEKDINTITNSDCPNGCGLCQEHQSDSCCVMLELTDSCNLACPVCYADSNRSRGDQWENLEQINLGLDYLAQKAPHANLLFSGGEPTLFCHLPELISAGKARNFNFFQLNTNGVRLAEEVSYADQLKRAGLSTVFLQFDAMDDAVYRVIRGRPLLETKMKAVQNCQAAGLGVVLVATLIRGVNDLKLKEIIQYALENAPTVRGVHLQPCSSFGRIPEAMPAKITLPELIELLTGYDDSPFSPDDFFAAGGNHALCSLQGEYSLVSGQLAVKRKSDNSTLCCCASKAVRQSAFIANRWAGAQAEGEADGWERLASSFRQSTFTITAKFFQDGTDIDLNRLKNCTLHVLTNEFRRVPFCAWNLTSTNGARLKRR